LIIAAWVACCVVAGSASADAYFGARRVIVIPTADALVSGDYQAALYSRLDDAKPWAIRETAIAFDFGLSQRLLCRGVVTDAKSVASSSVVEWDARFVAVRPRGGIPGVAVGVSGREEHFATRALYAAVTKEGNLPELGFFRLHFGLRGDVASPVQKRVLPTVGIEKLWYRFARHIRFASDWDGERAHVGFEQMFATGLRVGVAGLVYENAEREIVSPSLVVVVGFGNEATRNEIENAKKLARQAARIASQHAEKPGSSED
jgi:hypothetical protein